MPFYEYQCQQCAHRLEVLQKMSSAPLLRCPECHADALKKLISAVAFQLKGTGWYETDFKHAGQPKSVGERERDKQADKKGGNADMGEGKGENKGTEKGTDKSADKSVDKSEHKSTDKKVDKGDRSGAAKPAVQTKSSTTTKPKNTAANA